MVRILSQVDEPPDLIMVLDGAFEGRTTVAAFPAGEMAVAEAMIGHLNYVQKAPAEAWFEIGKTYEQGALEVQRLDELIDGLSIIWGKLAAGGHQ